MQLTLVYTVLATLAMREVSAIALPEPQPQPPQKYKIADSELGPVYSTVDPNHRRDTDHGLSERTPEPPQKYKIAASELGPVYSTVDPNHGRDTDHSLSERNEAYTPLEPDEASKYMKEKYNSPSFVPLQGLLLINYLNSGLHPAGQPAAGQVNKRTDAPLEKRDWASCVSLLLSISCLPFM